MRIAFQRTFNQFSENYLATFYSGGVRSLSRFMGGPSLIVIGAIFIINSNRQIESSLLKIIITIVSVSLIIFGLWQTLQPLINLFLVWLRRDVLFSAENAYVELEIIGDILFVKEGQEKLELPIEKIKSIQLRSESSWILTEGDYLISIPREGIDKGDHEKFITALEELRFQDEEEE